MNIIKFPKNKKPKSAVIRARDPETLPPHLQQAIQKIKENVNRPIERKTFKT